MATTVVAYLIAFFIAFFGFCVAIFMITMSGYFFARILLKVLGLHTGSEQQIRNEKKFAIVFAAIILLTAVLIIVGIFTPEPELTKIGAG
jgi:hypothetical protein